MNNTALGAEAQIGTPITFISETHEMFFYEYLEKVRYQDVYHQALIYTLGIRNDTRKNVDRIYDFEIGCVKPECLQEGWQTSGSARVVRLAFNLYSNGTPSVDNVADVDEQLSECRCYGVEEIFCCSYAPYFWQATKSKYAHLSAILT